MTAVKFLAHLVNQQILHEIAALELLTLLMEEPTDDSVEVAVGFIKVYVLYQSNIHGSYSFMSVPLRAYNFCWDGLISKLKHAFSSP